jgi:hypothetical protein
MRAKSTKLLFLLMTCITFACEKKELPAPTYSRGDIITTQVEMTPTYNNQIWFRLSDNAIVSTNNKMDWELGFESSQSGFHIILNSSKAMKAYKTNYTNLSQLTDTIGIETNGIADSPTGNLDSTAIGNWQNNNTVYIINRGYNHLGKQQGFYKLKIQSVSATTYTFEYADIYGTTLHQGLITKNADYTFTMFSLTNNQQLIIEPKKTEYDLCFTQYTHVYYNPIHFYQVTGVLSNKYKTRITRLNNKPFNDITISDTLNKTFTSNKNTIGFDWKTFSLNTNLFTIDPTICYIIQDSKGFYYKLHFIDFYNESGIKGYPKFEVKKL